MLSLLLVLAISYLLGSIPSSLWVGKLYKGIDIREHGSGNAGTTNTFRVLGWKAGAVVFALDFLKGFVASFWVSNQAFELFSFGSGPIAPPGWEADAFLMITCGLMAVVGHMFPVLANFKGGKGAATACGMLFGIEPISISISFLIFIIITLSTRYVSLASVTATFFYPVNLLILRYLLDYFVDGSIIVFAAIVATGIIYKHKSNIKRLLNGTESKISPPKSKPGEEELAKAGAEA
ncbi:glycerol-3-phosphate 1-O-acyltransferase PlsY [Balneola sp. MJW-20]|uniref:glycerol-3-phosphate 1-O-acyltransferase PlsY n=1 Tax=Gracilimonas aurantiaca TaxID=3234185 RepID=UPI003465BFBE